MDQATAFLRSGALSATPKPAAFIGRQPALRLGCDLLPNVRRVHQILQRLGMRLRCPPRFQTLVRGPPPPLSTSRFWAPECPKATFLSDTSESSSPGVISPHVRQPPFLYDLSMPLPRVIRDTSYMHETGYGSLLRGIWPLRRLRKNIAFFTKKIDNRRRTDRLDPVGRCLFALFR